MKQIIVPWMFVVAIAAMLGGSCAIRHRSDPFECDSTSDCDDGRTCSGGFCVIAGGVDAAAGDAAVSDARRPDARRPDASQCPSQCTSCDPAMLTCAIDCDASATGCVGQVVCPAGWNCNITCSPASSCRNGINCLGSLSCAIECSGAQSCQNIACGPGRCDVNCSGDQSCSGISCGQSCACDVACGNQASCSNVNCTELQCREFDGGCSSQNFGCDSCQ